MKVMNCREYEDRLFKPTSYTSPKLDGVRGFYLVKEKCIVSRRGTPLIGLDHIITPLAREEHDLDMELVIPGLKFNELSGRIRDYNPVPEAVAWVIDVPGLHWKNLVHRLQCRPATTDYIKRVPHYKVNSIEEAKRYHNMFLKDGYEGSVIKRSHEVYTHSRKWLRLVPVKSEDVIITGVYEGKGKFKNAVGGFLFTFAGFEDCKVGTFKGVTLAQRREWWARKEDFIGKMIEIVFKEYQPSGKMRHPAFKGFRYDK